VFRPARIAVEVRGCFWHGCKSHYRAPASNISYWSEKIARNQRRDAENAQELIDLAAALVARSADHFDGWGDVVIFAACTAARIGEVSGIRCADIDRDAWTWTVRRQTTPSPGGFIDKGTKGKRARTVPLIEEVRPLIERRLDAVGHNPTARIFTGPRGGRITTAVLRDATHWDEVVTPARPRASAPSRPPPHRSYLDGRCRYPGPCAPEDRRARIAGHHPALSPP